MDEKRKLHFNIIDFLIVLVLVGIGAALFLRYDFSARVSSLTSDDTIEYTIKIENIQKASDGYINAGDALYSAVNDAKIGTIVSKKPATGAAIYITLLDGTIWETTIPDRIDLVCTVRCKGKQTKDGYMLNGNLFIAPGKYISSRTKNVNFSFQVESVRLVS